MTVRSSKSDLLYPLEEVLDRNEQYIGLKVWEELESTFNNLDNQAKEMEEELEEAQERIEELEKELAEAKERIEELEG